MSPVPISRRRALGLAGLGVANVAAGTAGWVTTSGGAEGRLGPAVTGAPLREPPLLGSHDGRLAVELTAAPGVRLAGQDTVALGGDP